MISFELALFITFVFIGGYWVGRLCERGWGK